METPKTLEEVFAIEDVGKKIEYLKRGRKTALPNTEQNRKDWNPRLHDIMDEEKYKKIRVLVEMEKTVTYTDANGEVKSKVEPPKYENKEPNRIALPIEQDIVNIQTSFTVGKEPELACQPNDEQEQGLFLALKQIFRRNKLKYQNRKIVRAWLAEQDVAEYWYVVEDRGFWEKLKKKVGKVFGLNIMPKYRLSSQVWSPFLGDKIYPFYDEDGNYLACSREYKVKDLDGVEHVCFMCATSTDVYVWESLSSGSFELNKKKSFKHNLGGVPVMYAYRPESYTAKIRPTRERLEKCLSGYADCIDNHFFPKLLLFGFVENILGGDKRNQMIQLTGDGANARYLTWNQAADPIKVEIETYFNQAYALTNTPRISFDQLKGVGSALSGVAFRYFFMAAHQAVENHGEVLGEFFQRRVNFIIRALGLLNASYKDAANTIDVETNIVPYMIDSDEEKVRTAVAAVSGGVWSTEHGVAYSSDYGETKDEVERILEEKSESLQTEPNQE